MTSHRSWPRDPALWFTLAVGIACVLVLRALLGKGDAPGLTAILLVILVFPVLEELVFRGGLQPLLLKWTRQRALGALTLANLLTSVVFSLAHVPAHGLLHGALVFIPSLAFGVFRDRHDSVLPAIVLHAGWNAAAILLLGQVRTPL
ncbi:MAG: JDVT-CTERM system CAAX-type protease [Gammaproteobacteria bacterium]|nr:JDVT-CTERM system CAAX-type protease [Gammaproteobacteria bacterium]